MGLNPVTLIDKYINTTYDAVKLVADNIGAIVSAGSIADTHQVAPADPILRADGSALQTGDTYFNTTQNIRYTYTDSLTWVAESTHDVAVAATAASQSAALISEINAANSESAAAASETAAGLSETAAQIAQTAAELAETNAETAETNAAASAALIKIGIGTPAASASALALVDDGDQFEVSGSIDINTINTMAVGKRVYLTFSGAPKLIHHVSNLVLFNAQDIQVTAGDRATFQEYGVGTWKLVHYQRFDGTSLNGVTLDTLVTPGAVAVIDFAVPEEAREINVMYNSLSFVAQDSLKLRLGTIGGGIEATGYVGTQTVIGDGVFPDLITGSSTGFVVSDSEIASAARTGVSRLLLIDEATNTWICESVVRIPAGTFQIVNHVGIKSLTGRIGTVRITSSIGSNFDAGSVNVNYK
jgi:hypothetical protein